MTVSNLNTELKFDDVLSYLVIYIEDQVFDVLLNKIPTLHRSFMVFTQKW